MKQLLQWFIDNPLTMALLAAATVFVGLYASLHMPVDLFPNLDIPVVNIISHYPGAAPEDLELLISRQIESEMRGIPGVKRVASVSIQGISRVTVQFSPGVSITNARQLVQARLARVASTLPAGVIPRLENIGTTLQEVIGYVVYGSGDLVSLRNTVRLDLTNQIMGINGVSSVEVLGGDQRAFIVGVKPDLLNVYGLSINDIARALKKNNMTAVAGYLDRGSREYLIRGDARLETLDDLKKITLATRDHKVIPLQALATITEGKTPRHYEVRGNGIPAVAFVVRKQPGASAIRVAREVDRSIKKLQPLFPEGTKIRKFYDQSEIITEARDSIFHDLLLGAFLVVCVLYLFLGSLRPTLIVAVTIPITLIATMGFMRLFGLDFNVITFSALTLAVGMIVDDAIVVTENIFRHHQSGVKEQEAAVAGTFEIAAADAAGTFTTIAAFLPLALITGLIGLFLKPFGLTISISLVVSLALSLTLVPVLLGQQGTHAGPRHQIGNCLIKRAQTSLNSILKYALKHPKRILLISLMSLLLAGLFAFIGKIHILPPVDEGAILVEYVMPPGTALSESSRMGEELVRIARHDPDVSCTYRRTGSPEKGYQIEGVNRGEIMIKLQSKQNRKRNSEEIMARLKRLYSKFKGVVFLYHQPTQEKMDESLSGLPALFGVTIYGQNLDKLSDLASKTEEIMSHSHNISNVINPVKVRAPELVVRLNYPQMARFGLVAKDVFSALKATYRGLEATKIIRQKEEISILVKNASVKAQTPEWLKSLLVHSSRGDMVPLRKVARVTLRQSPGQITRLNGEREITLLAEVEGNFFSVARKLKKKLRTIQLPKGYRVEITGQYKVIMKSIVQMVLVVLGALLFIYLILAIEFHSLSKPLIILLTAPFSLVGAIVALFITRQGLDVSVSMGAITLIGICVNNAIVLLDFASLRISSGYPVEEALEDAALIRLRPILLTSLTTIFGLIPTAIGIGIGSKIFQPFSITVIGGLISATVSTLIIVPVVAKFFFHTEMMVS